MACMCHTVSMRRSMVHAHRCRCHMLLPAGVVVSDCGQWPGTASTRPGMLGHGNMGIGLTSIHAAPTSRADHVAAKRFVMRGAEPHHISPRRSRCGGAGAGAGPSTTQPHESHVIEHCTVHPVAILRLLRAWARSMPEDQALAPPPPRPPSKLMYVIAWVGAKHNASC